MHSSNGAMSPWSSWQPSQRANQLSFPPTQRHGLLDSTKSGTRSTNQQANLQHSFQNLLDALNVPALQHAIA